MGNSSNIFRENVIKVLRDRKIKQNDLAKRLQCTHEHLNAVLKGRAKLSRALMESIAEEIDLSLGELLNPQFQYKSAENPAQCWGRPDDEYYITWIPFLEAKLDEKTQSVRASRIKGPIAFKTEWLFQLGRPDQMAFVRTVGASLAGEIPDNAIVIVDRSQTVVVDESPYFLRIEKEMMIKRLAHSDSTEVTAYEQKMEDQKSRQLNNDMDWQIIGRCVWYSKTLN